MKKAFKSLEIIALLAFVVALPAGSRAQTWNVALNGTAASWNIAGNWSPATVPNAIDASAIFATDPSAATTVSMNAAIKVGSINVTNNSANILTFANGTGGSLTFDVTSGNATFTMGGTSATTNA